MASQALTQCDKRLTRRIMAVLVLLLWPASMALAADEPDLIFRRSTVFKLLSPNDKLATYGVDDPEVEGVACHFTVPEKGGFTGWLGLAEQVSDISLSCSQIGPIHFKDKMEQGGDMFRQRRSLFFKKMQIVRGCDTKRNVLVYMVYSDKLIDGSPKNSTSSVPIMPWGRTRRLRSAATSFSDLKSLSNDRTAAIGWAARSVCRPLSGLGYPRHAFRDPDNVTLDHFRTGDFLDLAGRAGAVVDADALPQPQIADVLLARHHLLGDRHTNQRRHGKAADQQSQKKLGA